MYIAVFNRILVDVIQMHIKIMSVTDTAVPVVLEYLPAAAIVHFVDFECTSPMSLLHDFG